MRNSEVGWAIEGFPNYRFTPERKLVNRVTGNEIRKILKGYTLGYCLHGKFLSLKKLSTITKKEDTYRYPF